MTQKMEILDKPKDKQLDYTSIKFYVCEYLPSSLVRETPDHCRRGCSGKLCLTDV